MNNELYTVSFFKVREVQKATLNCIYNGEAMEAIFCENEKGPYVIICKYRKTAPYKCCGHWHGGKSMYDVYYRINFKTREQGNNFYKKLKANGTVN